jgi:hypothetical protein
MGIFLGDKPVTVFFNGANASLPVQGVFLGGIQVFPTGTAATDEFFNNVVALLNFEQSTIQDLSSAARTVTVRGDAALSATEAKNGTKSLFCDGDGDGITIEHETVDGFAADGGDWTIEMWAYPTSLHNGHLCIISDELFSLAGLQFRLTSDGEIELNNASDSAFLGGSYSANQWQHFAAVRSSGIITIYRNGVSQGTTSQTPAENGTGLAFGFSSANFGNTFFEGYLDDIRYTQGVARYTSAFTPPGALPTS